MKKEIRGVVPPVVTPPTENHDFGRGSYAKLVGHLVSGGVGSLLVLGSSSEAVPSIDRRRDETFKAAVEFAKGRAPALAGAIDTGTNRVRERIKRTADLGVDAVVATVPFYVLQTTTEVERHFRSLAEASSMPMQTCDILVHTHTKLPGGLLLCLGKEGVFARVKDSSGGDVAFRQLCLDNKGARHLPPLLTGRKMVVDGVYLSGVDGPVPGPDSVDPAGYVRQQQALQAEDWAKIRGEQDGLTRLMYIVDVKGVGGFGAGIGSFRVALWLLSIFVPNTMFEPVTTLSGENVEYVRGMLRGVGLLS